MQDNLKTMSRNKKLLFALILLLAVLIGSILVLSWKLRSTSIELGYGLADEKLSFLQKVRYSVQIFLSRESLTKQKTDPEAKTKLEIQSGESVQSICNHLNLLHANLNPRLCRDYLVYRGLDRKVEPGSYSIPKNMPAYQVFLFISDPSNRNRVLVVFPGWRLEEIASAIQSLGIGEGNQDFLLEKMRQPHNGLAGLLQLDPGQSLEGYILPGDYVFEPGADSDSILWQLTIPAHALFQTEDFQTKQKENGLSTNEVLTLASIIQRETLQEIEMPIIASVFYNRLVQGMPLQTDPTVQYAIGYDENTKSWWKPVLSLSDLQINSTYNTYQIQGLPPSPIASPGSDAIQAVLNPEISEYLFFRAKCDGSGLHDFSVTYQEHLEKACP